MSIPENQLNTWSHQGSVTQSAQTYKSVKGVLGESNSPYYAKSFETFLQGSYANDTNVYRDSDIDITIRLDSTFYHDVPTLPADQQQAFERAYPGGAAYSLSDFKTEVVSWLKQKYGAGVTVGSKAIFIPGNDNRRDCDVLPCARFRYYYHFNSQTDQNYAEGICFFLNDGTRIVNFPKLHRENCTAKHQGCNQRFKPTVRIYKNMRNYMVDRGMLGDGVAPSYFIEGMLWNVPAANFGGNCADAFSNTFNYLIQTDRSDFKCANGIHILLSDGSKVIVECC